MNIINNSEELSNISFHPADNDDIQIIYELAQEIWREHYPNIIGAETVEYMLKMMYAPKVIRCDIKSGLEYFLIKVDKNAAGYFGIREEKDKAGIFISRLYLKKEYRGKRIGHKAINFICSVGKKRNLEEVYLTVAKTNTDSVAFYKSCGFTITGEMCKDIGDGFEMDDHIMSQRI